MAKVYPDRTRKAWDTIGAILADNGSDAEGHWVAIRLSDGSCDGRLYGSKEEATRFQLHEMQCAYVCIHPFADMSINDIHTYLELNEKIYNAGGRLSDVGTHVVPSTLSGTFSNGMN